MFGQVKLLPYKWLAPACAALALIGGCSDPDYETTGQVGPGPRAPLADAREAETFSAQRNVLFGDLHVHSTFSMDAFEDSLPGMGGEGPQPLADACDYARYCSQLDFWSINDHAMALTPARWTMTREAIRQCNAEAGPGPDMVAFTGWEWTQIGPTPDRHWGHKNVIFPGEEDHQLPPRAVRAGYGTAPEFNVPFDTLSSITGPLLGLFTEPAYRRDHWLMLGFLRQMMGNRPCDAEAPSQELPGDCAEGARTPAELFRRIDEHVDDYLVIPHGNSWGLYTPPGASWDKQLQAGNHDPQRQRLIEVYSGHGNSEEYRSWRGVALDAQGEAYCPPPQDGYVPCCWQAGEIIRAQCADPAGEDCERQVLEARQNAVAAGASSHLTLTNVRPEEWLNCGQCPDCFLPAFSARPGTSAQASLAVRNASLGEAGKFRFGFIAASDNHGSRPGTGYKEIDRQRIVDRVQGEGQRPPVEFPSGDIRSLPPAQVMANASNVYDIPRSGSMLYSGGLAAVHSEGRSREAIWEALKRREVYGTSGPRIYLSFDHLPEAGDPMPMGSELETRSEPRFRVRAMGALKQRPGCPDSTVAALGEARLEQLCGNECYYPGNERQLIERIEVVRIWAQPDGAGSLAGLVEDPWRIFQCDPEDATCEVEFTDPEYTGRRQDVSYYVRAVQAPTDTINGAGLRCQFDGEGNCVAVNLCYSDSRTPTADDCLAPVAHRAWSSPIFLDFPGS